jgi:hypothetical protein
MPSRIGCGRSGSCWEWLRKDDLNFGFVANRNAPLLFGARLFVLLGHQNCCGLDLGYQSFGELVVSNR